MDSDCLRLTSKKNNPNKDVCESTLLTCGGTLVSHWAPLPQPPGELADVSPTGGVLHVLQEDFDWAGNHLQESSSSFSTAVPSLGPCLGFPNKVQTDIPENKFTHYRQVILF